MGRDSGWSIVANGIINFDLWDHAMIFATVAIYESDLVLFVVDRACFVADSLIVGNRLFRDFRKQL